MMCGEQEESGGVPEYLLRSINKTSLVGFGSLGDGSEGHIEIDHHPEWKLCTCSPKSLCPPFWFSTFITL